ncbi:MAG: hypothetical protein R3C10_03605 [Pirellulales bacterium]|nr:hypothetical protein [Planctomycetales bacterium]
MLSQNVGRDGSFRVWVARCDDWNPADWSDVPPTAVALEPAEPHLMTRVEAAVYVEAFNRAMLARSPRIWALPVRVTVRLDGDLANGQPVDRAAIATELFTLPTSITDDGGGA